MSDLQNIEKGLANHLAWCMNEDELEKVLIEFLIHVPGDVKRKLFLDITKRQQEAI